MTMPDRIQITYQPKTMAMPDFCALCAELLPVEPPQIFTTMAMQFRSAWREGVEDGWNEARAVLARKGHPPAAAPAPGEKLVTASEDLATDQMMKANLSALLVEECGLHSSGSSTYDLLQRAAAMLVNYGLPARPTYLDAIRLAEGCHDYSGGHSGPEGEAWHGAIDTVVDVLKRAAIKPWDSQTMAVFGVGVESGRVAVPGPVSECPYCGYKGEMVPAPQAGDVALAGDRRSAESLQLAHESCRLFGTKNGDCPDSEICWLDLLPCSHYENCATIPASQSGEGEA